MSFSGGVYTLPGPALVTGEVVSATENNQFRNDVAGAFNVTMLRNGTSTATANLPMGGYKLTGLGLATTSGDALSYGNAAVVTTLTSTSLTATRVPYAGTGGLLQDASTFTFDGTTLTAGGFTTSGAISAGTITASGAITVSGGAANGVAYLNGSKVLTTGSALTFDGSKLGVSSSGEILKLTTSGNTASGGLAYLRFYDSVGARGYVGYVGTDTMQITGNNVEMQAATADIFTVGGSEQMRLTSTGLGIGTSSPSVKLDVRKSGTGDLLWAYNGTYGLSIGVNTGRAYIGTLSSSTALSFGINGDSQAMTLDSSGNLGLGVTPSAWSIKAMDINTTTGIYGGSNSSGFVNNAYYNAGFKYKTTNTAGSYEVVGNEHRWGIAPSGTAGNAISFTQAMTLDASGNLGIGTSSPATYGQLAVYKSSGDVEAAVVTASANYATYRVQNSTNRFSMQIRTDQSNAWVLRDETNAANRFLVFPGSSEAMRIDSSGNLLVGTATQQTGGQGKLSVAGGTDGVAGVFTNDSNGGAFTLNVFNYTTATGGGVGRYIKFAMGSTPTQTGSIIGDGTNTAFNTSSDYRLKENIMPMSGALDLVMKQRPVTWTWKSNGKAGKGFIAHWLQEDGAGECVTGEKDAVDENGNPDYQGVDTSFLVATLTKAIQELKAELDATKAEVAALKGN